MNLNETDITKRLLISNALFNDIHLVTQKFDILPDDKMHYGASIAYQDIQKKLKMGKLMLQHMRMCREKHCKSFVKDPKTNY